MSSVKLEIIPRLAKLLDGRTKLGKVETITANMGRMLC